MGVNGPRMLIENIHYSDRGWYQVWMENEAFPQLLIQREPIFLNVTNIEPPLTYFQNGISPNNDGINDTGVIVNIQYYAEHNVQIYNQEGTLVYENSDYDNLFNPFKGEGNRNGFSNLEAGTYYYLVDVGNPEKNSTGYIVLKYD